MAIARDLSLGAVGSEGVARAQPQQWLDVVEIASAVAQGHVRQGSQSYGVALRVRLVRGSGETAMLPVTLNMAVVPRVAATMRLHSQD